MTGSIWLPGLIVLGVGILGGLLAALRLRRAPAARDTGDLELRVADLAARREELYERLRAAVAEQNESEVERLEIAAARVLRALEESSGKFPAERVTGEAPGPAGDVAAGTGWASRHPLTVGFLFGAGLVALVGVLVYWAVQDAGPRPDMATAGPPPSGPAAAADAPPHEGDTLPPEIAARVAQLEGVLVSSPDDLAARRELALIHLQASQFVEAFQQSQQILDRRPDDLDALYVQGVVRLTMGQLDLARGLFDRVLAIYPEHVRALVARGAILLRLGDREGAIADWEDGIEAAGGAQPEIEALLARARAEAASPAGSEEAATPPQPAQAPSPQTPSLPAPAPAATPAAGTSTGPTFRARITIDRVPIPGAVLFVSLRGQEPGPPAAVRRIDAPRFPLDLTLDASDSMLGRPLPASGTLSVRLDADGSASTREPTDPSAEVQVSDGDFVEIVLR